MRTVDPELWCKRVQKPTTNVSRPTRHGQDREDNVEARVRSSFRDAMKEYWTHCSVEGVKRISDQSHSTLERSCDACVVVAMVWCGALALGGAWAQRRGVPPRHVSLHSAQHSIRRIPFPAVALCSASVISEAALTNYTTFLYSRDRNKTLSSHYIRENLLSFGSLLTMHLRPSDANASQFMFMQFLTQLDPEFEVAKLLHQFAPPCDAMLRRCSWRGRVVPCERLFATRVTPLGYCCVSNSRYYSEDNYRQPNYLDIVGKDYGLSVVVKESLDEFAFVRRPSAGLEVLLFDGSDYPILEGGGVRLYPVEQNASVYMSITAKAQYPSAEALPGCRGRPAARGRSGCLTQCRARTLAAVCGCRPHTLPPDPQDNNPLCSLAHLSCLNKHREKFIYYYPHGYRGLRLKEEFQNGQKCSGCAADCARYVYAADITTAKYCLGDDSARKIFKDTFMKDENLENTTVIRLYYSSEHQELYVIEVYRRWFETVATVSSQWSAMVGATLIAASEAVYFCTVRWAHHYRRRRRAGVADF